ncbi:MAG: YeeE/YedE thiosulfate transporter family protein [Anaerolineales bacterium]
MNFPLAILNNVNSATPWVYLVFGLIGFGFGYVLEMSGFGNSRKLSAQFYFRDLTVLKVMFTAIVVAMVLTFGAVGLGILDFNQVYVNPTYLSSGILGGFIMGIGFILGGFCPGTSVVSASTGKIDGIVFLTGGFFGAFLFGETERFFTHWWNTSGYYGRVTLMDVFGVDAGVVVVGVVLMALFMFWGAEQLERIVGKRDLSKEPKLRVVGAAGLLSMAILVLVIGTPNLDEKWARLAPIKEPVLAAREVYVSPAEMYHTMFDNKLISVLIDVRPEAEYNLYHINGAINVPLERVPTILPMLQARYSPRTVYFVMSNDEIAATQAWKILTAGAIANVYILEGGINNWITFFGADDPQITPLVGVLGEDQLRFAFPAALGARYRSAYPDPQKYEELEFEPKIKLQLQRDKTGGGCG